MLSPNLALTPFILKLLSLTLYRVLFYFLLIPVVHCSSEPNIPLTVVINTPLLSCKLKIITSNKSHLLVTSCLSLCDTLPVKFNFILVASCLPTSHPLDPNGYLSSGEGSEETHWQVVTYRKKNRKNSKPQDLSAHEFLVCKGINDGIISLGLVNQMELFYKANTTCLCSNSPHR